MSKLNFILLTATLALATAFTFSCSDDGGGGGNPVKKARISGVSQKGPFVEGSTATLYELNNDLSQTGRTFRDIIADNKGTFEIKDVELASPYAMLEADGFYRNEVTGQVSAAPIKLYAIADVREKDNVNVNIITHLEYYRVLNLVEGGKAVAEAKKQAQKEILAVFGINSDGFKDSEDMSIFGTSESDAALLAISILLQGDLSEGPFSQRLTNFSQAIRNGGVPGEAVMNDMADWASDDANWNSTADLGKIKDNILAWGLSNEVPDFEKYVSNYWAIHYGLGICNDELQWVVKEAEITGYYYICKNGYWKRPKNAEMCIYNDDDWNVVGCFIDERDGQRYMYYTVTKYTVMMENLNYSRGNTLGYCYGVDMNGTNPHRDGSGCNNGYGRVYEWEVAMDGTDSQGLCPNGWRIPSYTEYVEFNYGPPLAGNYDYRGWKERDVAGFWWTSSGNNYFQMYYCDNPNDSASCSRNSQSTASPSDLFSIYCIKD